MAKSNNNFSKVDAPAFIDAIAFCPFANAENLLAIGSRDGLCIGLCKFNCQRQDNGKAYVNVGKEPLHEYSVIINISVADISCIAWSPASNMKHLPRTVIIGTGTKSGIINIYTADVKQNSETEESPITAHEDCVNDLAFEPIEGQELVSVSDDHTSKVWNVSSGELICSFPLGYPGMSVCWHPEQQGKFMVAELGGRVRFYDMKSQQAILSVDCKKQCLTSADWCWLNQSKIGASSDMEWHLWDITKSSFPLESQQSHSGGCSKILWSKHNEDVFLTLGSPKNAVKVYHLGHRQPIMHKMHEASMSASWHRTLPICAVAGNEAIHFYDVKILTEF